MAVITGLKGLKIRRIVRVSTTDGGARVVDTIYRKRNKRKKQSRGLKDVERVQRRAARAERNAVTRYLDRHKRSNRKRRDGWARDHSVNVMRAARKGLKVLRRR
jgi:hypothetical protein